MHDFIQIKIRKRYEKMPSAFVLHFKWDCVILKITKKLILKCLKKIIIIKKIKKERLIHQVNIVFLQNTSSDIIISLFEN